MANIFDLFKLIEKNKAEPSGPVSFIVAGLGNPGDKYARTRHNMGFMCLDYISQSMGFKIDKIKFKSICGEAVISDRKVLFMKPQTMMNLSGEAIRDAASFYKIDPQNIVVIHDDMAIEAGNMRIRRSGSDGGHNGLKSIIYQLNSDAFPRIKIGIGSPGDGRDVVDWVLGCPSKEECEKIYECIKASEECVKLIVSGDTEKAMNTFNKRNAK